MEEVRGRSDAPPIYYMFRKSRLSAYWLICASILCRIEISALLPLQPTCTQVVCRKLSAAGQAAHSQAKWRVGLAVGHRSDVFEPTY